MLVLVRITRCRVCHIELVTGSAWTVTSGPTSFGETRPRSKQECVSVTNQRWSSTVSLEFGWKIVCTSLKTVQSFSPGRVPQSTNHSNVRRHGCHWLAPWSLTLAATKKRSKGTKDATGLPRGASRSLLPKREIKRD